ncbi:MAG: RES family NAD+ phosphorylase [Campylobacterales bacterium]|nr:RES family NAD+ phosphorylase [Campylobacterales bacterium]
MSIYYCSECFSDPNISRFIEKNGEKNQEYYICECGAESPLYKIDQAELRSFFQSIVKNIYEYDQTAFDLAYSIAKEEGDPISLYAPLYSLEDICSNLFNNSEKVLDILNEPLHYSALADGEDESIYNDRYTQHWMSKCFDSSNFYELSEWEKFCENVKHKARYFNHKDFSVTKTLDTFKSFFKALEYSKQHTIYRAREVKKLKTKLLIKDNPSCELGKVPITLAKNNRFSPIGISYGYFALDKNTAIKEIRAEKTSLIAIGVFSVSNNIKLLDFRKSSMDKKINIFDENFELSMFCQRKFILEFLQDISKPIEDDKQLLEYVPTQVMAEYIWHLNYDGFLFESSQNKNGINLVIFKNIYNFVSHEFINEN